MCIWKNVYIFHSVDEANLIQHIEICYTAFLVTAVKHSKKNVLDLAVGLCLATSSVHLVSFYLRNRGDILALIKFIYLDSREICEH